MSKDLEGVLADAAALVKKERKRKPKLPRVEKDAAALVLKEVAKELPAHEEHALTRRVVEKAHSTFESAIGGRQKLIDSLLLTPESVSSLKKIQKLLGDPDFALPGKYPLFVMCQRHKLSLADVVQAFRDATVARLNVEALTNLAVHAPAVVSQVADDAQNRHDICHVCDGSCVIQKLDNLGDPAIDVDGSPIMRTCPQCRGKGTVYRRHDVESRKHFLKITGILDEKKGPIAETNINQIIGANFTPGDGTFERFIKSVDKVIDIDVVPTSVSAKTEPIIQPDPATDADEGTEDALEP